MFRMNSHDLSEYVAKRTLTLATFLFACANEAQASTLPPAVPVTQNPHTTATPTVAATPPPFPTSTTMTATLPPFPGAPATIVPAPDVGGSDHATPFSATSAGVGIAVGFAFGVTVTLSVAFCALQFSKRCRKANTNEEAQPLVRREMS
jgi:hypothetical protein